MLNPNLGWLAPELRRHLPELVKLAHELQRCVADEHKLPDSFRRRRTEVLDAIMAQHILLGRVVRIPYLTPQACRVIQDAASDLPFKPNCEEAEAFQMDECVLERWSPSMYQALKYLHDMAMLPLWNVAFGLHPEDHNSVQLAKYGSGERNMTNWHYDRSSDCTTTVLLSSPDEYVGGGMQVFPGIDLGSAAMGEATLFQGRTLLHRSNPVTSGERLMLVHWVDV